MSAQNMHHDWLSLIEISGPFLAVPVLKEAFPPLQYKLLNLNLHLFPIRLSLLCLSMI